MKNFKTIIIKKFIALICILFLPFILLNAKTDSLRNVLKINLDLNPILRGEGIDIEYICFEKNITKNNSIICYIGYDLNSSNLIVDNHENVIDNQSLKFKIDYRHYFFNKRLNGPYVSPSLFFDIKITNKENNKNNNTGISFGLGYQKIWNCFALDIQINKQYSYSFLQNDDVTLKTSAISPFNITVSVGYVF